MSISNILNEPHLLKILFQDKIPNIQKEDSKEIQILLASKKNLLSYYQQNIKILTQHTCSFDVIDKLRTYDNDQFNDIIQFLNLNRTVLKENLFTSDNIYYIEKWLYTEKDQVKDMLYNIWTIYLERGAKLNEKRVSLLSDEDVLNKYKIKALSMYFNSGRLHPAIKKLYPDIETCKSLCISLEVNKGFKIFIEMLPKKEIALNNDIQFDSH